MSNSSVSKKNAQKHWDHLNRIAKITGTTRSDCAAAWLRGLKRYSSEYKVSFLNDKTLSNLSKDTDLRNSILKWAKQERSQRKRKRANKKTKPAPSKARVAKKTEVKKAMPYREHVFEVVYKGDAGKLLGLLSELPCVQSVTWVKE